MEGVAGGGGAGWVGCGGWDSVLLSGVVDICRNANISTRLHAVDATSLHVLSTRPSLSMSKCFQATTCAIV